MPFSPVRASFKTLSFSGPDRLPFSREKAISMEINLPAGPDRVAGKKRHKAADVGASSGRYASA